MRVHWTTQLQLQVIDLASRADKEGMTAEQFISLCTKETGVAFEAGALSSCIRPFVTAGFIKSDRLMRALDKKRHNAKPQMPLVPAVPNTRESLAGASIRDKVLSALSSGPKKWHELRSSAGCQSEQMMATLRKLVDDGTVLTRPYRLASLEPMPLAPQMTMNVTEHEPIVDMRAFTDPTPIIFAEPPKKVPAPVNDADSILMLMRKGNITKQQALELLGTK